MPEGLAPSLFYLGSPDVSSVLGVGQGGTGPACSLCSEADAGAWGIGCGQEHGGTWRPLCPCWYRERAWPVAGRSCQAPTHLL